MSIENYIQLQSDSDHDSTLLGVQLPQLTTGLLNITHHIMTLDEARLFLANFKPVEGWVMYRDTLEITPQIPNRDDVIEAEYCKDQYSLTLRLIAPNRYSVCEMQQLPTVQHTMVYKIQLMSLQKPHIEHKYVQYHLWYQQQTTPPNQSRWQVLAQQFMGFATLIEDK